MTENKAALIIRTLSKQSPDNKRFFQSNIFLKFVLILLFLASCSSADSSETTENGSSPGGDGESETSTNITRVEVRPIMVDSDASLTLDNSGTLFSYEMAEDANLMEGDLGADDLLLFFFLPSVNDDRSLFTCDIPLVEGHEDSPEGIDMFWTMENPDTDILYHDVAVMPFSDALRDQFLNGDFVLHWINASASRSVNVPLSSKTIDTYTCYRNNFDTESNDQSELIIGGEQIAGIVNPLTAEMYDQIWLDAITSALLRTDISREKVIENVRELSKAAKNKGVPNDNIVETINQALGVQI